ncbi:MAG: FHA domain-containing protein [Anaeromyxobacteraceae bacterium]
MASLRCPRCGGETDARFAFCHACGQDLRTPPERTCAGCGAKLEPSFRFCGYCGRPADPAPPAPSKMPVEPAAERPGRSTPAPRASEAAERPAAGSLRLVAVRHDGVAGTAHPLGPAPLVCGRGAGHLRFDDDATVDPEHARFTARDGAAWVEDLGTVNGTFVRLRGPRPLSSGDELRLGRQLLRLDAMPRPPDGEGARPWGSADPGYRARLSQLLEGGGTGEVFPLRDGENTVGRELAHVAFPGDRYVSARHARIDVGEAAIVVADLGSSNGTFVRIIAPTRVAAGDQVLIGMQLVRLE